MLALTIVIVNYRTAELTVDCLASVMADPSLPAGSRVMVVDGASGDASSKVIGSAIEERGWGDTIALVDLPTNGGFAYGNNRAIEAADERWGRAPAYLLLNPDTVVLPGAIGALTDFLNTHPRAGIVGSSLEDPDTSQQACSFRFPSPWSEFESEVRFGPITRLLRSWRIVLPVGTIPSQADWVSGAAMMVRREVFEQIGWLDEGYFLYYEELDFCRRAVERNWQCWTVPKSRVIHLCGQSTGVSTRGVKPKRRPTYWFNSRNRYFEKHHGRRGKMLADLAWVSGQGLWHLRQFVQRRSNYDPPHLLRDFLAHRSRRAGK